MESGIMNDQQKNKEGFIQTPILLIIISGLIIVGALSYVGVTEYNSYRASQTEKERQSQELILTQEKALENTREEIETLKDTMEQLTPEEPIVTPQNTPVSESQQKPEEDIKQKNLTIDASELGLYLSGVVKISCKNSGGSGSLWNNNSYHVLTNAHVVDEPYPDDSCLVSVVDNNEDLIGVYKIYINEDAWLRYDSIDAAAADIKMININDPGFSSPIKDLNYKISSLRKCSDKMQLGLNVVIIGFPAFGEKEISEYDLPLGMMSSRIITEGIISGYDYGSSLPKKIYPNYFVSAKIDAGNSGGIALSKDENGICVLGIPSWLSLGQYETQGIVQNIYNIFK